MRYTWGLSYLELLSSTATWAFASSASAFLISASSSTFLRRRTVRQPEKGKRYGVDVVSANSENNELLTNPPLSSPNTII